MIKHHGPLLRSHGRNGSGDHERTLLSGLFLSTSKLPHNSPFSFEPCLVFLKATRPGLSQHYSIPGTNLRPSLLCCYGKTLKADWRVNGEYMICHTISITVHPKVTTGTWRQELKQDTMKTVHWHAQLAFCNTTQRYRGGTSSCRLGQCPHRFDYTQANLIGAIPLFSDNSDCDNLTKPKNLSH